MSEVKNWQDFFNLTKKVREAQKDYFKTRTGLNLSKKLEGLLDKAIRDIDKIQAEKQQKSLFQDQFSDKPKA